MALDKALSKRDDEPSTFGETEEHGRCCDERGEYAREGFLVA